METVSAAVITPAVTLIITVSLEDVLKSHGVSMVTLIAVVTSVVLNRVEDVEGLGAVNSQAAEATAAQVALLRQGVPARMRMMSPASFLSC